MQERDQDEQSSRLDRVIVLNEQLALYRDVISCYTPNTVVMHLMRCETHGSKYQLIYQLNVYHLYHGFNWWSYKERTVDALALEGDEGRGYLR